ncbi:MAG TPA: hypothetical protein VF753_12810 [Terriglobales bacterium]
MPTFEQVKRGFFVTIGAIGLLVVVIYGLDYVVLRFRGKTQLGSVVVTPAYVIHEKSGPMSDKTEYSFGDPVAQTCVNSIFPHLGYSPCWYLQRNPQQKIEI